MYILQAQMRGLGMKPVLSAFAGQHTAHHTIAPLFLKWRNIWIRDVFCYLYAQDKCPIMNQRSLFHP